MTKYELWNSLQGDGATLATALELLRKLDKKQIPLFLELLQRQAELLLYRTTPKQKPYHYLSKIEEDMIKSILVGDSADVFISQNSKRKVR